jgi:uncharacterized YigZ family protein
MLFDDQYKTIEAPAKGSFRDKGSRFLAFAFPVATEQEVKTRLEAIRKEYYDATHHCYAYVLGADKSAYRANDDGEPSGTAGRPIQGTILSADLTNILIIVVRYYGGTKLGVPGLINAYKTAAKEALSEARELTRTVHEIYRVSFAFDATNDVMRSLKEAGAEIRSSSFDNESTLEIAIRKLEAGWLTEKLMKIREVKVKYLDIC